MLGHNRRMTGAECLAEMLGGYGVTHVFMVPAVLWRTFAEMERRTSIARIHTHGEKSAAYMADGYARASGKPGICMAQVIGALNLAAGLRDAYLAHSPVIAFTGGRDPAKSKAELIKYLKDSFDYSNRVLATLTANNALDRVEGRYAGPNTKLGISVVAVWHITDHYGQLVEYLRLNGIVPPMTQKYGVKVR